MEQKHNKQLHKEEYVIEYSAQEQQLIYEVILGTFQKLLHNSAGALWNILEMFCRLDRTLRCRIFREYSKNYFINHLLLIDRIFHGILLCTQLFVMFLYHFFMEYS